MSFGFLPWSKSSYYFDPIFVIARPSHCVCSSWFRFVSFRLVLTVCTSVIEMYAIYVCSEVSIWIEWGIVWIFCPQPVKWYFSCISIVVVVVVSGMIFPEIFVIMLTIFDISFVNRVIVASFLVSCFANSVFFAKSVSNWGLSLDIIATRFSIAASNFFSCASNSIS